MLTIKKKTFIHLNPLHFKFWMNSMCSIITHQSQRGLLHNIEVRGFCCCCFFLVASPVQMRHRQKSEKVMFSEKQPRSGYSVFYPLFEEVVCSAGCFARHPLLFDAHNIFRSFRSAVPLPLAGENNQPLASAPLVNNERPRRKGPREVPLWVGTRPSQSRVGHKLLSPP